MELIKTLQPALVEGAHSKKDIAKLADAIVTETLEKETILEMVEKIAATEELIKQMKSDERFKNYALDKISAHKNFVSESGTKIELCEAGTKYHFENCNDPVLMDLYTRREEIERRIKERESFLKTISSEGIEIRYEDVLLSIYPPYKTSTTTYKVTLSK